MDKNSQRKIIEDKIRGLEGNSFQEFCDRLCLSLFPDDYTPVRPGGVEGDTKNDGYCPKARIFFQAHATRGESLSKTKSKIKSDLAGCRANYSGVRRWVYLTNDTLAGAIHKSTDVLRQTHPNLKIELWDHKMIADKISNLPQDIINYILDINLLGDSKILAEVKELLGGKKGEGSKDIASSAEQNQQRDIKVGFTGNKPPSKKGKSEDYKKVVSLYKGQPTKEDLLEVRKIVYSSEDQEAILQAILALVSWYKYSPDTAEDQNTLIDLGIQTALNMKAKDAEAILRAEKGINVSTQFVLLDLEGWGKIIMTNSLGWPVITPQEQAAIIGRLKSLDLEFKELFRTAINKAIESKNYLAVSRIFSMIGSAAGGRAQHFTHLGLKDRAEFEKKVCKSSFMYAKGILINANDKAELALLMHNFANALRGFGEKEEALDLVNKAIKIAKENKVENFMDKAQQLKDMILHPVSIIPSQKPS
ncbi:MAG TPA: tetratricopeptide repeat protein [Patescibacteria group bacterium]